MQNNTIKNIKTNAFFLASTLVLLSCTQGTRPSPKTGNGVVVCNGQNCVSVGFYNRLTTFTCSPNPDCSMLTSATETKSNGFPLAVLSKDGGQTFTTASVPPLPKGADTTKVSSFTTISCVDQRCVGAGLYNIVFSITLVPTMMGADLINIDLFGSPFVALSNDGGLTFSRAYQPMLPSNADPLKLAGLTGMSCIGKRCVGTGVYNFSFLNLGQSVGTLFALVSNDGGQSFPIQSKITLPSNTDPAGDTEIDGISCTSQSCAAVGRYNQVGRIGQLPLALFSDNLGNSFSSSQPPVPIDIDPTSTNAVQLNGVSCSGKNCVAVGYYQPIGGGDTLPYTVFSNDSGKTFQSFSIPALPMGANISGNNNQNTQLESVTCEGQRCVAVGVYYSGSLQGSLPLAMVSTDGGQTFQNPSQPALPNGINSATNAQLDGVTCTGQHCVATGFYNQNNTVPGNNGNTLPLAVVSEDGGLTFSVATTPALPANAILTDDAELGFNL